MFKVNTTTIKKSYVIEKLNIIETPDYKYVLTDDVNLFENDKINIYFNEHTMTGLVEMIKLLSQGNAVFISVENSRGEKRVSVDTISYFEAFDNEVFAIINKERFYVLEKLYVLEQTLTEKNFVRVSKSFLVNIAHIEYIRPMLNSKLKLIMTNKDVVEVNRTYVKSFKERMDIWSMYI